MSLTRTELLSPFTKGCKAAADFKLGLELEHFVAKKGTVEHMGYSSGVAAALEKLATCGHWKAKREGQNILGLESDFGAITLEPSAAIEFSTPPRALVSELEADTSRFYNELNTVLTPANLELLFTGFQPQATADELELLPKSRYRFMYDYMPKVGTRGRDMMKLTASIQVCIDFASEADAMRKMVLAAKLTPFLVALSANSATAYGKPSGHASHRAFTWLDTDNSRFGYPDFLFNPTPTFTDYAEWALDVPVYFVERNGESYPLTHLTFRKFLAEGATLPGTDERIVATKADWDSHLGTLFPWVRLRHYIELRAFDMNAPQKVSSLLRLVKGIFYTEHGLQRAEALVAELDKVKIDSLLIAAIEQGLGGKAASVAISEVVSELQKLAVQD